MNKKRIKLSIIIPVYNVERYLEQCLNSIVVGNVNLLGMLEVIVVDDGSPDRSGEIADRFAGQYPCVKVIHQKNAGVAAARNTGIRESKGEWLYFVDSDDWLQSGAITEIIGTARKYPAADILFFDAWQNEGNKEIPWEHFDKPEVWKNSSAIRRLQYCTLYYPYPDKHKKIPVAAPWDKVYRREFLEENAIQFRKELKVLDDMVFNTESFGAAREVVYTKEKIYHYRYVPDSITNNYKSDRVEQDKKVWSYLQEYAKRIGAGDDFARALRCRIVKSFSICCRLCFFNGNNAQSRREKIKYVKQVLASEPYYTAFHKVRLRDLEWKLQIMAIIGRLHWGYGVYLLHVAQNGVRNASLSTR